MQYLAVTYNGKESKNPYMYRWLGGKEPACQTGDAGSVPGSGRSPGEGNSKLLQYSCLENLTDRGAWQATVHMVAESDMRERTCVHVHTHTRN